MRIGALIVTTGLPRVSGVTALLSPVETISAGQRMISAFQSAGVTLTGPVVGPEDKKSERQLVHNGVIFLRCDDAEADFFHGVKHGLSFMQDKFERVFLVPGDTPLSLPSTLEALLKSTASMIIPEYNHVSGYPLLLDKTALTFIPTQEHLPSAGTAIRNSAFPLESVSVEDSGILIRGEDMSHREILIQRHNSQLSRPVTEVLLCSGTPLYDSQLSMLCM